MRKKSGSNNGKGQMAPKVERTRGNANNSPMPSSDSRPNGGVQTAGNKTSKSTPKMKGTVPGQPF